MVNDETVRVASVQHHQMLLASSFLKTIFQLS
jgi:hypothetical protein